MGSAKARRGLAAFACVMSASLVLAACGGDDDSGGSNKAEGKAPGQGKAECEGLTEWGDLTGKTVKMYTSIVAPEDQPHIDSYKLFETCTGAKVDYEGSKEFEAQLVVRVRSGNPPDLAYIPQPGLLNTLVKDTGKVVEVPDTVSANVDEFWSDSWRGYGTVDGKLYAAPLGANMKSFVWYSPKMFEENGWEIPTTWDDMIALSDTIAATGIKPWCAGIGSGDATGWPVTDWLEDVLLRDAGIDVYNQWVAHEIPFNDPQFVSALDRVGDILKNDKYVNGGIGDVKSIATTIFQDGGLPILKGKCALHRQAGFYAGTGRRALTSPRPAMPSRSTCRPPTRTTASRCSAAASSWRRSTTVPRSRRSRPTSPRTPGPTRRQRRHRRAVGSVPTTASTRPTWSARSMWSRPRRWP